MAKKKKLTKAERKEARLRQRLLSLSRQGWGRNDENADREDQIWRQEMKRIPLCHDFIWQHKCLTCRFLFAQVCQFRRVP